MNCYLCLGSLNVRMRNETPVCLTCVPAQEEIVAAITEMVKKKLTTPPAPFVLKDSPDIVKVVSGWKEVNDPETLVKSLDVGVHIRVRCDYCTAENEFEVLGFQSLRSAQVPTEFEYVQATVCSLPSLPLCGHWASVWPKNNSSDLDLLVMLRLGRLSIREPLKKMYVAWPKNLGNSLPGRYTFSVPKAAPHVTLPPTGPKSVADAVADLLDDAQKP